MSRGTVKRFENMVVDQKTLLRYAHTLSTDDWLSYYKELSNDFELLLENYKASCTTVERLRKSKETFTVYKVTVYLEVGNDLDELSSEHFFLDPEDALDYLKSQGFKSLLENNEKVYHERGALYAIKKSFEIVEGVGSIDI